MSHGLIAVGLLAGLALAAEVGEPFSDDFEHGYDAWTPIVPELWEIREAEGNHYLALTKPGKLREGVRRPAAYVRLDGKKYQDLTFTAKLMSLRPTTLKGRDCVLIWGWQDDTHFYYGHVSNDANGGTHNVIMKVAGDKRTALQSPKKPEPRLSDGWHTVRVKHTTDGAITVWMDDLEEPLMTGTDTDYPVGQVGLGSFDDNAAFDDVTVEGTLVE